MTVRIALLFAYDGSGFHGFARQRSRRTVQGLLEEWLTRILRAETLTTGAGRTDAGVHAAGQVVSFDAPESTDPPWLQMRLNKALAPEVSIKAAVVVAEAFDARFSAKRRIYDYAIYGGVARDPFLDRFAWWVPDPLDIAAMNDSTSYLVGEHDFSSFCRAGARSLVRRIRSITVSSQHGGRTSIHVEGDSFCHQMVRSITGLFVSVGRGERPAPDVKRVLDARDRSASAPVAPPHGLTLTRVVYRPDPFRGTR